MLTKIEWTAFGMDDLGSIERGASSCSLWQVRLHGKNSKWPALYISSKLWPKIDPKQQRTGENWKTWSSMWSSHKSNDVYCMQDCHTGVQYSSCIFFQDCPSPLQRLKVLELTRKSVSKQICSLLSAFLATHMSASACQNRDAVAQSQCDSFSHSCFSTEC